MSKALYLIAMDLERFQVKGFFEIPLSTLSGDMCSVMFHLFFFFWGGGWVNIHETKNPFRNFALPNIQGFCFEKISY